RFSAPVSRALAEAITLKGAGGSGKPYFAADDREQSVHSVSFKPPFAANAEFTLVLPENFRDLEDRPLANAAMFPLKSKTAGYPPLAKFAAAPFGILELNADPVLPLTLRNVEANPPANRGAPGTLASLKVEGDADIIDWIARVDQYHEGTIERGERQVQTRTLPLLGRAAGVRKLNLPPSPDAKDGVRPFEVIGVPLPAPGYYVLELESQRLGNALLGAPEPMFVRTSALVTNLAVHVKLGRSNGTVWVTTLDAGKPVAGADVRISDCYGKELWRGKTGADGVAPVPQALEPYCSRREDDSAPRIGGLFVSARKTDAQGRADMAFALTSWNNGIESWRFNLPTDTDRRASVRAHTVFDRTLLRAGETVSMKHLIRTETLHGFGLLPAERLPTRVRIVHQGSGQEFQFPLRWRGRRSAETAFAIPREARLGRYEVTLDRGQVNDSAGAGAGQGGDDDVVEPQDYENTYSSGSFRVEEFRLPLLSGRITPPKGALVAPKEVPLDVHLSYLNGGGAAGQRVQVSSLLRTKALHFAGYDDFSFHLSEERDEDSESPADEQKIVADKQAVALDRNGAGRTAIKNLPPLKSPQELLTEMSFADPNGEIQTVSAVTPLWPAGLVVGIKSSDWVSVRKKATLTAVALDVNGKPQAGVPVTLRAVAQQTSSHRKRMVGGFYTYENTRSSKDLGQLCSGKTDTRGLLLCEVELAEGGNIIVTAQAKDGAGNAALANTSLWVMRAGEVWFDGDNQDRIDILPEKKSYQPGETAKFQVRMPFRHATALVALEREGVLETRVLELSGKDPSISLPVKAEYGPNVYVSVLAVRGRLREVPWYSFFSWGWKEPLSWWHEFRHYQAPGPIVDLSKPAWKYGIAEIAVGGAAHELKVQVSSDKPAYPIRATARVTIQATLPDGKPAAGAEVALAAVDEALLELQPNTSWDVLAAMLQRRSYGVETATAQMQVVGKRHYGRKAIPAGGGGGKAPTRELFDTLLLWQPALVLDANGRAQVDVPLNDALTGFRIVAVADSGAGLFGTGRASIRSTQDLQLISGLPPLVREGDSFSAMLTLRNTTERAMQVTVEAKFGAPATQLEPKKLDIAAGQSAELNWPVTVPADVAQLAWEVAAQEQGGAKVRDAIRVTQKVVPAVPVTVQQATLFQLDHAASLPLAPPAGSLPGRGGIAVALAPRLAGGSAGLRRYFEAYPYSCLEQKASRAIGLKDDALWQRLMTELPTYLDGDGLVYYYPPRDGGANGGSDALTAYLLAVAQEANFALPQQARERMLAGLEAFVEGRLVREHWSPKKDLEVRKLAALEALSRYGRARPDMLGSIQVAPNLWPTSAVLDWIALLRRLPAIAERDQRLQEADQIVRARLNYQGTRLGFSSEAGDYWWWLMASGDSNATRLILTVLDDPAWRDDLPKLLAGALARQQRGHWATTTANLWGTLALDKFGRKFEADKVGGTTRATLDGTASATASQSFAWTAGGAQGGQLMLPWPGNGNGNRGGELKLTHDGSGKPWATVQSLAALPLAAPFSSGYRIAKSVTPVGQKEKGAAARGDIYRVELAIDAQADMSWVVVHDPIPAGATLLGSGLGRDSAIAAGGERASGSAWLAYEERSFEFFRAYYQFVPKGKFTLSYTYRLNNAGRFQLPPTRVEALYAPEMFGELPNPLLAVKQ
ncbi:MAG: MG2 domain-containing protein, partial [Burkholderiaceae bacterium]